ncbi:uncharacterized protein LOC109705839 isoform X1 [Ananas comosus]|uniref:RING-type E3 ubiquitin transferase n=1 Tax=Ananas comosus TaxID=4615 RepID=A0A6P5ELB0_ANACO|nr:uncharacterized protein LOC109705839 isoform X1 [Ananas comosus]XP_020082209.1 uncharacterized protein LOC109705839 isoform X1 [Ananas comosus]
MGYLSETKVEEFESKYDDSEGIFEMAWSPFWSILPRPRFTFLTSFSFLDDDFESEWEVGWRRTPRISKKAVDAMPTVEIDRSINCPICLEEFAIGEEAKEMPCKHKFHRECIVPWLETHCSCPLCRFEMPADDLEDSNKSDGIDGDGVEVDGDSGRRESRRNVRFAFVRSLWSHGYGNSYWNGSDGGGGDDQVEGDDDNDNDGDSGRRESRRNARFAFFPSLWSHGYGNSYRSGSDGGGGDDRVEDNDDDDDDGVGGGDGRRIERVRKGGQGFVSYVPWRSPLFSWCRSNESFYPTRRSFSSTPRGHFSGKFSLDATKGFPCRIIPSVFQGMHSKKLGGFHELDEYNTLAMRTSGNERCYKLNMYNENWVNPSGKMGDSLWRDSAFATKETDQSSSF